MDIQSSMIWTYSNAVADKSKSRNDAFADPLERPEWQGLGWAVPLISRLASGRSGARPEGRKTQAVERFTTPSGARSICVS